MNRREAIRQGTLFITAAGLWASLPVGIGRFIVMMTQDCYAPEVADEVRRGLRDIEARSQAQFGRTLPDLRPEERETLVTAYEKAAGAGTRAGALNPFRHVKELTLLGYFTSEPGATQALRYDPVPGTYRGSVPLAPGDRSWTL